VGEVVLVACRVSSRGGAWFQDTKPLPGVRCSAKLHLRVPWNDDDDDAEDADDYLSCTVLLYFLVCFALLVLARTILYRTTMYSQ
jgi:hypothetical protein